MSKLFRLQWQILPGRNGRSGRGVAGPDCADDSLGLSSLTPLNGLFMSGGRKLIWPASIQGNQKGKG